MLSQQSNIATPNTADQDPLLCHVQTQCVPVNCQL